MQNTLHDIAKESQMKISDKSQSTTRIVGGTTLPFGRSSTLPIVDSDINRSVPIPLSSEMNRVVATQTEVRHGSILKI
jgi:hypothetical protein